MAPFDPATLGSVGAALVYLLIGVGFGAVLELAGFGNSRKLAAQFYLRDLTVLKVMFTAIITAMVLIFGASAIGILDYELVWVNPTYLWPGIVGGLIMGVGFIIGGFCPGTSLVAAATLKLDGIAFLAGVFGGVFAFGETVHLFERFWNSSALGRVTIQDWLGVDAGIVVLGVVLMALALFRGAEWLERYFAEVPVSLRVRGFRPTGAFVLAAAAAAVLLLRQPSVDERWQRVALTEEPRLTAREVQIEPAELLSLIHDDLLNLVLLDVRPEAHFNVFHLPDARRVELADIESVARTLVTQPRRTVIVLMSNDEERATQAWKTLAALRVPNAYLLEGGINGWLAHYGGQLPSAPASDEQLRFVFDGAWGGSHPAAAPAYHEDAKPLFVKKVKILEQTAPKKGGCG